ncbi:IclR family transcriptional regulator [Neisseria animalis]|uniref:IclR family transcriptional regulator n=1 Tax=Neisseria animalis TaxID=492 RepID=A0A5P3MS63_NEIAN|nr:IclR family transcriptional regulator [Neisseria animalis]QEY23479.1 IclR family transcriptional regulator [Neisseria animalis]ROW33326.1 IclR family transcriptional regulator [Neisseria animalis]VEE09037.1 Transcriptional regulator kdgR [Neisseria animalis]
MSETESVRGSSITRVLEILETVAEAERPLVPYDLIQELGIPKPSLHRLLQLLEGEGFIQTDLQGGLVPGVRAQRMSINIWQNKRFKAEREAVLNGLSAKIGETCGISIPHGNAMVYSDRVQTNWPLQVYLPVGTQVPLYCTAGGKLYLSTLNAAKRKRQIENMTLTRLTQNTLTDTQALLADIKQTEKCGYGTDDQEFVAGLVGCAVPIADGKGNFLGGLIVHSPIIRKSLEDLLAFLPEMRQAAQEIGSMLEE